jgi:hypothetical protein
VNPQHLFVGTPQENVDDKVQKGRHCIGERNGNVLLTESDVRAIRAACDKRRYGQKVALAKRYGVSFATIQDITSGRTWRWVE